MTVPGRSIVIGILATTAIVVGIAAVMLFGHPRGKTAPPPSIAVLPLAGDSGEIRSEIITALQTIPGFQVKDASALADARFDLRKLGEKMNVRTVLDGSVEQGRIRIKLINASDEFELWSHTYAQDAAFKDAIARDVAAHVSLH